MADAPDDMITAQEAKERLDRSLARAREALDDAAPAVSEALGATLYRFLERQVAENWDIAEEMTDSELSDFKRAMQDSIQAAVREAESSIRKLDLDEYDSDSVFRVVGQSTVPFMAAADGSSLLGHWSNHRALSATNIGLDLKDFLEPLSRVIARYRDDHEVYRMHLDSEGKAAAKERWQRA